ncbi:hypothetical protein SAMN05443252_105200 [Bacillus sp. OV322]|uniref:hypothetical protein n=1 Tax=Bacillus sp. OV322 TaxID=1882764 RepID=UPI0008EF33CA|nr:hypothetical protein SAMN05443252_105200 [Bacillus sp. OV322]
MHPHYVYQAITALDIKTKEKQPFFKIPIQYLKNNENAIYIYSKEKYKGPAEPIEEGQIKIVDIYDYKELPELPSATSDYYKNESRNGNRFGLFHYVPHFLSLGEVEIGNVEIITWNEIK